MIWLILILVVLVLIVALVLSWPASTDDNHPLVAVDVDQETTKAGRFSLSTPALACLVVFGMCLEKGLGYGFPSADIDVGVSVEFSRLFYAAGLVIAGITTDHSRLYGTVCAICALVTPFALLALAAEPIPATVLWSLDYFLFGFSSVFRVVLFLDLAERTGQTYLAPFGLLWGRLGDAAGNALCLMLGNTTSLVAFAGVTFAATIIAAIPLLQRLFTPDPVVIVKPAPQNDNDQFDSFAQHYDLSRREREVLQEVLARHTNVEAAEALFVSESTIKFHMRNLLKKTGCKRRADLRELYARETES
jgi:DNA-binding CsgD family transcriptional regulator